MHKNNLEANIDCPFVSIIVPTLNEENNLPRLFQSLTMLTYPKKKFEVIVVDGGSGDKTVEIAKKYGAKVLNNTKTIRGAGCQIGIENAKGEYIAFTDADCEVPKNWLADLLIYFRPEIASVGGPNITPSSDSDLAKAVGVILDLLTRTGSRYGYKGKKVVEIYHNSGCNVIYRKEAIQKAGGFDINLLTCEDEELDFRIRKKGDKLLFTPFVVVDHFRRPTYRKIFEQARRYAVGRAQAIRLHFKMGKWFHFLPSLLIIPIFWPFLFLGLLGAAIFLSMKKGYQPFYVYFLILLLWLLGWSLGFLRGLIKMA